jgi:TPR repeat protein
MRFWRGKAFHLVLLLSSLLVSSAAKIDDVRKDAEQGVADAQFNLGVMYADAQFNLGVMYANGDGIAEDDAEAAKWFRKAAEQGHAEAQSNLGFMHANGEGVDQDDVSAYMWYNLAAAQGLEVTKENKGIISERMTREQIAKAQKLSRSWLAKHSSDDNT